MKKLFTIITTCAALGFFPVGSVPVAFGQGNGNGNAGGTGNGANGNGNAFGEDEFQTNTDPAVIAAAVVRLSAICASESGGNASSYESYARSLALTLDQKSSAELDRILGSSDHFGLGQ